MAEAKLRVGIIGIGWYAAAAVVPQLQKTGILQVRRFLHLTVGMHTPVKYTQPAQGLLSEQMPGWGLILESLAIGVLQGIWFSQLVIIEIAYELLSSDSVFWK